MILQFPTGEVLEQDSDLSDAIRMIALSQFPGNASGFSTWGHFCEKQNLKLINRFLGIPCEFCGKEGPK